MENLIRIRVVLNCGGSDAEERRLTSRGLSEPPLQKKKNGMSIGKDISYIETI